jgi:hypothetical protein
MNNIDYNFINEFNFNQLNCNKEYDINYLIENGYILNFNQIRQYYPDIIIINKNNQNFINFENKDYKLNEFYKQKILNIKLNFFINKYNIINSSIKDCLILLFVIINNDYKGFEILKNIKKYVNLNNISIIICLTNNLNIRKFFLYIKKNFTNYLILKTLNYYSEILALLVSYNYIKDKIKFKYIFKLDTYNNFDSSILINNFYFIYHYFIYNDLLILHDNNFKKFKSSIFKKKNIKKKYKFLKIKKYINRIFFSDFFICKKFIFDKNINNSNDILKLMLINPVYNKHINIFSFFFKINFFLISFFERKELTKIIKIKNHYPIIHTIISCYIKNKKDLFNIFSIIDCIKQKNNIIIIFKNSSKFVFEDLIKNKYPFLKIYKSNIKNHLFNYLIGFKKIHEINNKYKLLFLNNEYNFNINKILDFCLFNVGNFDYVNIFKKFNKEIYYWYFDSNFSNYFFKNVEKFIIINYLPLIKNFILFLITNNNIFYKNIINIKFFFNNFIDFNENTIINDYNIIPISDIYKYEGNIKNKFENILIQM